ncbi:MAG: RcnB family protein [Desulfobacteraceae bacterium]|nr:RcnB family protein [Desulfobacteraceae bacterium]
MKNRLLPWGGLVPLMLVVLMAVGLPAGAERPAWTSDEAGGWHGQRDEGQGRNHKPHQEKRRDEAREERYFDHHRRQVIRDYYREELRAGHCPPGLARKRNGCLPPGQVRSWAVGRPLPPGVRGYELPPQVVVNLGPPPIGYRYVRVGGDILLIATGTAMVMDAIMDLGR